MAKLQDRIAELDRTLSNFGLRLEPGSPVEAHLAIVREYAHDAATIGDDAAIRTWDSRFEEYFMAKDVFERLVDATSTLKANQPQELRSRLKRVVRGSLAQDFEPDQAKDIFFELVLATWFKRSGFDVYLREPDIVVAGRGLSAPIGLACKYPSSEKQVHDHISKGYHQIDRQRLDGLVVLGCDLLVFEGKRGLFDFRRDRRPPLEILYGYLSTEMGLLIEARKLYPEERQLDGVLLVLSAVGVGGSPARQTLVRAATMQFDASNPRASDYEILLKALNEVRFE